MSKPENVAARAADLPAAARVGPTDDIFIDIAVALRKVVGAGSSIRMLAEDLPETPLGFDNVFCPELVFPAVAGAVIEHANTAMSLVEKLDVFLKGGVIEEGGNG